MICEACARNPLRMLRVMVTQQLEYVTTGFGRQQQQSHQCTTVVFRLKSIPPFLPVHHITSDVCAAP